MSSVLPPYYCYPRKCTQAATILFNPYTADYADFADAFGGAPAFSRVIRGQNVRGIRQTQGPEPGAGQSLPLSVLIREIRGEKMLALGPKPPILWAKKWVAKKGNRLG